MMAIIAALSTHPTFIFGYAAAKAKSGSSATLLILVVIASGFYFLILRPQQQKAKRLRQNVQQFEVGDEVLTAGGIVGHIIDIDGDRVTLETSMGASFVVLHQYILRKLSVDVPAGEDHDGDEYENGGDEYDDDTEMAHDGGDEGAGGGGAGEATEEHDHEHAHDDHDEDEHDDPDGRRPKQPS